MCFLIAATQAVPTFVQDIQGERVDVEETVTFEALYSGNPTPGMWIFKLEIWLQFCFTTFRYLFLKVCCISRYIKLMTLVSALVLFQKSFGTKMIKSYCQMNVLS